MAYKNKYSQFAKGEGLKPKEPKGIKFWVLNSEKDCDEYAEWHIALRKKEINPYKKVYVIRLYQDEHWYFKSFDDIKEAVRNNVIGSDFNVIDIEETSAVIRDESNEIVIEKEPYPQLTNSALNQEYLDKWRVKKILQDGTKIYKDRNSI